MLAFGGSIESWHQKTQDAQPRVLLSLQVAMNTSRGNFKNAKTSNFSNMLTIQ